MLRGSYYMRQIAFSGVDPTGGIERARALYGVITFDGEGNYSVEGRVADNRNGPVETMWFGWAGNYAANSAGMAEIVNPLDPRQVIRAAVGGAAVVGSSTEGDVHDLFVAVPKGSGTVSADTLAGTWRAAYLDLPQGKSTLARTAFFTMTANGQGALGDISLGANGVDIGSVSESLTGASYQFDANGRGRITFPGGSQVLAGNKLLYLSADGKVLIGGAPGGFDLLVAVRGATGATDSLYQGTYYTAGFTDDPSQMDQGVNHFFFYSGSATADGQYGTRWHFRINPAGTPTYDLTMSGGFHLDADGLMNAPQQRVAVSDGGDAFIETGNGSVYRFILGVRVEPVPDETARVWLNPIGVVNAASYAPVTNPVAPGEMLELSGIKLARGEAAAQGGALPTELGGVQVTVNGIPAPLFFVSPTIVKAVVPYAVTGKFATFQVFRDAQPSNPVSVYVNLCSPGVFTTLPGGTGPAVAQHADRTPVSAEHPAHAGQDLTLFLTGLGAVTPQVSDGAPGDPDRPNRIVLEKKLVLFINGQRAPISLAALSPALAGVYEIRFQVPEGTPPGDYYLGVDADPAGFSSQATIRVE